MNVVRRIRLLGFTAIRLPFSMQNLINDTARDFQWTACPNIAASDIIASVINPDVTVSKSELRTAEAQISPAPASSRCALVPPDVLCRTSGTVLC